MERWKIIKRVILYRKTQYPKDKNVREVSSNANTDDSTDLEKRLEDILSKIAGVENKCNDYQC